MINKNLNKYANKLVNAFLKNKIILHTFQYIQKNFRSSKIKKTL